MGSLCPSSCLSLSPPLQPPSPLSLCWPLTHKGRERQRWRRREGKEGTKGWELWACPREREGEEGGWGVTEGQRGAEGWGGEKPESQKARTGAGVERRGAMVEREGPRVRERCTTQESL